MSEEEISRWIVRATIAAFGMLLSLVILQTIQHRNDPEPPCSSYSNTQRANVPARCFVDFNPERP